MQYRGLAAKRAKEMDGLLRELASLEAAYNKQKIVFFKPIPGSPQDAFFAGQLNDVRLVLGSNRSGKTVCGWNEANSHSLGFRPWFPVGHPLRTVRLPNGEPIPVPNVGRIIAQNYEQAIRQTIMDKFDEWAPKAYVRKIERNTRGIPVAIHWINGSIMYLMSNDQDDMAFEGPNGHWFWADEPIDYRKYTGLRRGLVDHQGHCWLTMTPLSQPWINDIIVSKAGNPGSGVEMYRFSIWDNCIENGGHLERAAIESFLSDLREDELEARLHGNFIHLAGRVYKAWEPTPPYWVPPFEIPPTWPRVMYCDPHDRKPLALMWEAWSPTNVRYIYRSVFDRNIVTIKDAANFIKQQEGWFSNDTPGPNAEPVAYRIIDWSANKLDRTSGMNITRAFADEGITFDTAKKHGASFGYDAIHEALKVRAEWGEPGLVVFNDCVEVKQNFLNFCYDNWATGKQEDLKGPKESYNKKDDDFIDPIRYGYQARLSYNMLKAMLRNVQAAQESEFYEPNGRTVMGMHMSDYSARALQVRNSMFR